MNQLKHSNDRKWVHCNSDKVVIQAAKNSIYAQVCQKIMCLRYSRYTDELLTPPPEALLEHVTQYYYIVGTEEQIVLPHTRLIRFQIEETKITQYK